MKELIKIKTDISNIRSLSSTYTNISIWSLVVWICFKKLNPVKNQDRNGWEKLSLKTKYYNSDIHLGSFMLPQYVKEMLDEE